MKRSSGKATFAVQSYIGSDIAQFGHEGERPPRSAKHVVSVDLGGGPGGGDYRTYFVSTNRERTLWILWARADDYDSGRPAYCRVASGAPYGGYSAKFAAERLLARSWEDEIQEGSLESDVVVTAPGLLTKADVRRIVSSISGLV